MKTYLEPDEITLMEKGATNLRDRLRFASCSASAACPGQQSPDYAKRNMKEDKAK